MQYINTSIYSPCTVTFVVEPTKAHWNQAQGGEEAYLEVMLIALGNSLYMWLAHNRGLCERMYHRIFCLNKSTVYLKPLPREYLLLVDILLSSESILIMLFIWAIGAKRERSEFKRELVQTEATALALPLSNFLPWWSLRKGFPLIESYSVFRNTEAWIETPPPWLTPLGGALDLTEAPPLWRTLRHVSWENKDSQHTSPRKCDTQQNDWELRYYHWERQLWKTSPWDLWAFSYWLEEFLHGISYSTAYSATSLRYATKINMVNAYQKQHQ